ncbi:hypothetical protein PG995_007483 [Apiospora arundinis]
MASQKIDIKTEEDKNLFRSGALYDTIIYCQSTRWGLHRGILTSRCQWFKENLSAHPKEDGKAVFRLNDFSHDLVNTLLEFIYTGELGHPRIGDHRVLTTLFNMSIHYKFAKFADAVIMEANRCARVVVDGRRGEGRPFKKPLLDELIGAVRIAYNGDSTKQQRIRKVYRKLFADCKASVQKDKYFYDCMRAIPIFMVDMQETINFPVSFAE